MTQTATLPALEWQRMPLDGRVLIEASAGTGKTFNIGLIYLRLLLERGLRVEQILVTTFTDAAAQELRERLRRRLVEAGQWLGERRIAKHEDSATTGDASLDAWLADFRSDEGILKQARRRIQLAVVDFDRAPIATFHALCQRILRDYPLESGAAFAAANLVDEKALLRECVEDFWRQRYSTGVVEQREAEAVLAKGPDDLLRDLGSLFAGEARVVAADGQAEIDQLTVELRGTQNIAELRRLAAAKHLFARGKSALSKRMAGIANALESGESIASFLTGEPGKIFDAENIDDQQSDTTSEKIAAFPLVRQLQRLRELLKSKNVFARGAVLAAALEFCREELPRRAQQRDAQTYSMLIDGVHARLGDADAGNALAECLFKAFPAALVDEFQDTDQRQFEILDRIFREGARSPRGSLVMIGDPKQAIYGFRGGDIAAYLRASNRAAHRFSLAVNQRSSSALVGAVNALYGESGDGFDDPSIRYQIVRAAGRADEKPYAVAGVPVAAPMRLHDFRGDAENAKGEPLDGVGELEKLALEDCANRIAELLNDPTQSIAGRRLTPGDIAVLLPNNAQIAALRKRLIERHVPCVGSGRGSVFGTEVARELELILYAVLNADDDCAVRGALSTRLLGATYADLRSWQTDTAAFERELERFSAWRELVRRRGVLALVEALSQCGGQLTGSPEAERLLTDLRHLGELLAQEERARHGLEGLHAWFAAMRRDDGDDGESGEAADARRLRIESDAQRVQLLTVHGSKGLEFPIVFLPLAWRISDRKPPRAPKVLKFHDDQGKACVDLGSADFAANQAAHFREDLQERLRLLYVALTRAVHAVHVYWVDRGRRAQGDDQLWQVAAIDVLIRQAREHLRLAPDEPVLDGLAARLSGIGVSLAYAGPAISYHAPAEAPTPRVAHLPLPALRTFEWLHSFSSLARQTVSTEEESGAADEVDDVVVAEESRVGADADAADDPHLLALYPLRGPRFGNAVHNILEAAKPGQVWPGQRALVETQFRAQALRPEGETTGDPLELIGRMVDRVRDADLGEGLRLASLADSARVAEFEFQFPLRQVSVAYLRSLCEQHGCADVVPVGLQAISLNGMLTGFADMVFAHAGRYHVLDYKTNWLGARVSDYTAQPLDTAMREHHYDLQALLYTVALHRYLGGRMDGYAPEQHLGGSWYLFLRGIGLRPGLGVWRQQWPTALVCALDRAFAGDVEAVA